MSFFQQIESRSESINSLLCVGLDPHKAELPSDAWEAGEKERCEAAYQFCARIIDATSPHTVCYKPNAAFFEALGANLGNVTLRRVIDHIPADIPVLLDVKRGDIGSTAAAYAEACYDEKDGLNAGGVTLSPLMGWDSVQPFVTGKYADKGAFILCKTSNPGSNDLLALSLRHQPQSQPTLFEKIANLSQAWSTKAATESPSTSTHPRLGLVVGATDPQALSKVRQAAGPNVWILAPGVGAQGGDLDAACFAGLNEHGSGMLIPVSRGISRAADPALEAKRLKEGINEARKNVLAAQSTRSEAGQDGGGIARYQKEFLEFSLSEGVLKFGSFVLKSGRTSPYFFNAGLFSSGGALHKLGKAYAAAIMASDQLVDENGKVIFDVVFGPAYKGISLGALVCAALYSEYGVDTGFAYNRKEAKDHGEGGILVGASMVEKRVLIVDDVITAGTAIRESFDLLTKIKATPVGVSIALDRAEKRSLEDPLSAVQAVARDLAIPVVSIVALPQLQGYLRQSPNYDESVLKLVSDYRSQYGV
mmetsp:Transcript_20449/g.42093  ORF Transcript_20449/g.42093 Transcript_20449/m.42093 type:complete len:534 (-) Transcript_20449:72-1673(-)